MTSQDTGVGARPRRTRDKNAPVDAKAALESVLLSAHRISVTISTIKAFGESGVTVAEWEILRELGDRKDVPLRQLVQASGVSRQRLRKVLSELQEKKLIASNQASGDDKRARSVSATPAAARVLASISTQLEKLLSETGQAKQGRKLALAASSMNRLARQLRRSSGEEQPKRGEGKDRPRRAEGKERPRRAERQERLARRAKAGKPSTDADE